MIESIPSRLQSWERPSLVVLSRGTPEEAVLTGCKAGIGGMSGAKSNAGHCNRQIPPRCNKCNKQGTT